MIGSTANKAPGMTLHLAEWALAEHCLGVGDQLVEGEEPPLY